jgi:hypothetical protein
MNKKGLEWHTIMWIVVALVLGYGLFVIIKNLIGFTNV